MKNITENYAERKLFHYDYGERCIRITKNISLGFSPRDFKRVFRKIIGYKAKGQLLYGCQKGSLFWQNLSLKEKILDKNYGLRAFFQAYHFKESYPTKGKDVSSFHLGALNLYVNKYYNIINNNEQINTESVWN